MIVTALFIWCLFFESITPLLLSVVSILSGIGFCILGAGIVIAVRSQLKSLRGIQD